MKTIMCFGDSNTWGYVPGKGNRYPINKRWTGLLQNHLGDEFVVIEEGLNGRTTVLDEPFRIGRNGSLMLLPLLESHAPIDLLIIMLGTNDLKHYYGFYAADVARGLSTLIGIAKQSTTGVNSTSPKLLLICPPRIKTPCNNLQYQFVGAELKSEGISVFSQAIAKEHNCYFLDSSEIVEPSPNDGVHLDEVGHSIIAKHIYFQIKEIFK